MAGTTEKEIGTRIDSSAAAFKSLQYGDQWHIKQSKINIYKSLCFMVLKREKQMQLLSRVTMGPYRYLFSGSHMCMNLLEV